MGGKREQGGWRIRYEAACEDVLRELDATGGKGGSGCNILRYGASAGNGWRGRMWRF